MNDKMNNKLQRLATKMFDLLPSQHFESPQECFDQFRDVWKKQYDYLNHFDSSSLLKLILYIYSYKNTGNFKLADNILNKIGFASLFITQGEIFREECDWCQGAGERSCGNCSGDGVITCSSCNGTAEEECSSCDGEGVTYQHGEEEDCDSCQGTGKVDGCSTCGGVGEEECSRCDGSAVENCDDCDGTGEVDTEEKVFNYYVIATWNKFIKDRCELNAGTMEPALSEYDYDRLRDDYIIIGFDETHREFRRAVQTNEVYCTTYEDEPKLFANHSATLWMWIDDDGMDNYTL
jgi:hypothetical protein